MTAIAPVPHRGCCCVAAAQRNFMEQAGRTSARLFHLAWFFYCPLFSSRWSAGLLDNPHNGAVRILEESSLCLMQRIAA